MRVLVTGDRNWRDARRVCAAILEVYNLCVDASDHEFVIVHGDARGADTHAEVIAQIFSFETEPHPADWENLGRRAGPVRNQEMLDSGIDLVLAFHDDLVSSKGTLDMVKRAEKAGIEVRVIGNDTR